MLRLLILAAVAACLALAACGGDDDEGGGDGDSRAEFAQRVNRVCDEFREELAAVPPPQTRAESREFDVKAEAVEDEFVERLRAQDPPEDVQADYEQYVAAHAEALELVAQIREARDRGDERTADRLQEEITEVVQGVDERAAELDLTSCGGSGAQ